jgi:hypothetical protein
MGEMRKQNKLMYGVRKGYYSTRALAQSIAVGYLNEKLLAKVRCGAIRCDCNNMAARSGPGEITQTCQVQLQDIMLNIALPLTYPRQR